MAKKPKLGSGKRFAQLKSKLAHEKGVTNPGALAASIGRKKYGNKKMAEMSAHGSKHKMHHLKKMHKKYGLDMATAKPGDLKEAFMKHPKGMKKHHMKKHMMKKHKMTTKADHAYDHKHGIKEGSKRDMAMDKKHGVKEKKHKMHHKVHGKHKKAHKMTASC